MCRAPDSASPAGSIRCNLVRSRATRPGSGAQPPTRASRSRRSRSAARRARRCDAPQAQPVPAPPDRRAQRARQPAARAMRIRPARPRATQRTIACGSFSNFSASARSKPVAAMRPSSAQSTRRTASQPSQAPLPSSEIGIPQPPTRWVCPRTTAQPTVPVPETITPPSRTPCAPRHAACASVVIIALRNGCG